MSDVTFSNSVDIIMPTYNPDLTLVKRAIASIVDQTYKEWKLFIVNDGGEAELSGIVKEFNDERINYYVIPHKGKPGALNFAISKGAAKYIAYLDDDDIWYPNHLETAISYMTENNVRFLHTDAHEIYVTREGENFKEVSRGSLNKGIITDITMWHISHINAVHERSLLEDAGSYDENRSFFIDWDMFQRLAKHAKPYHLKVITCEHYMYLDGKKSETNIISSIHKNDAALSRKAHHEMFKRAFEILSADDYVELLNDWQVKDAQINQMIEKLNRIYHSRIWRWGSKFIGFLRVLVPENSLRRKVILKGTQPLRKIMRGLKNTKLSNI